MRIDINKISHLKVETDNVINANNYVTSRNQSGNNTAETFTVKVYENKDFCFAEAKLKKIKSWEDNHVKDVTNDSQKCISVCSPCFVK